ncbi:uncharacterized protein LOC122004106 isoform X1 [Zingiber officinale]|uniref:uncharacterized protein LOC122004106 isoform X1 n=1 Tax=Zingiber officinale TaxID=94328 RepID=UPI001C4C4DB4|nr:uncharacterized protein LOC122004106 isoform X1 [Zingiber officinale]
MASSTSFPSCLVPPALPWKRAARQFPATRAKKEEAEGGGTKAEENTTSAFSLSAAASTLARPAVAAFGLGFLDAGGTRYSGDWSRIGAISKETEEFLKIAAYFVVPFCFLLIYFISEGQKDSLKDSQE